MSGFVDSYRPNFGSGRPPPDMPDSVRQAMFAVNGTRTDNAPRRRERGHDNRRRRNDRPYSQRPNRATASRPLLRHHHGNEENILRDTTAADKFRNLDEITDSEEDDMSVSDEDPEDDRPTKKAKTADAESPVAATVPQWSNPDPYTALPPSAEGTTGKRTDVLKLIRKAKIEQEKKAAGELDQNEDFISFGDLDHDDDDEQDQILAAAPDGPRRKNPFNASTQFDGVAQENTGKRKRGEQTAIPRPPGGYLSTAQAVLKEWRPQIGSNSVPWFRPPATQDPPGIALHKEVIDFFEWVRPQEYEQEVRADIVNRLNLAFNRIEPGQLKAFGSYAAALYLPIGDMDLVYMTRQYRPGRYEKNGLPPKPSRGLLDRFVKLIKNQGLAEKDSVKLIPWAKVPIIKFVEIRSGLNVDLSFNNDTGLTAVETFHAWKVTHPIMPILVSIVKQFLMIRGLNDVATGGLGGFSIICLVTSFLQHLPTPSPTENIGRLLVEFFNLYGYMLDRDHVTIRMDPPGYIEKASYRPMLFSQEARNRLTIIDPNRPENNISGGTHLINRIIDTFRGAHGALMASLAAHEQGDPNVSFLRDLVGGNFNSYEVQRNQLAELYYGLTGVEAPSRSSKVSSRSAPVHRRWH